MRSQKRKKSLAMKFFVKTNRKFYPRRKDFPQSFSSKRSTIDVKTSFTFRPRCFVKTRVNHRKINAVKSSDQLRMPSLFIICGTSLLPTCQVTMHVLTVSVCPRTFSFTCIFTSLGVVPYQTLKVLSNKVSYKNTLHR